MGKASGKIVIIVIESEEHSFGTITCFDPWVLLLKPVSNMKSIFTGIFLFAGICSISDALRCYDCRYDEGSSSMESCEKNPGPEYSKEIPFWQNPFSVSKHVKAGSSFSDNRMGIFGISQQGGGWPSSPSDPASLFWYCMKIDGKYNGRKVVIRGSAFALAHSGSDVCENRLPTNLESLGLTDVKTCYCDTRDNCNGSSAVKLSFFVVFVGVILSMLKK